MATPDPREPYGRLVHEQRLAVNAERHKPFGVVRWEERDDEQRELDMRIGSAVAAQAVADAKLETDRARVLLLALGAHRGAIFDALTMAIAGSEYEDGKRRYRNALKALGGDEGGAGDA